MVSTPEPRRSPRIVRFLVTGGVLGLLAGTAVVLFGQQVEGYSLSSQLGYFGVFGAAVGVLLAGLVVAFLDR
jgi:hypothetical protein